MIKNIAILLLLIITALHSTACICKTSENNFYKNLGSENTVILAVMENLVIGDVEYNDKIEVGDFRVLDVIYNPENIILTDTLKIYGNDGLNCNENLSQFNIGDTLFLTINPDWQTASAPINLYGCNASYLKVENGKCKGLPLPEVIQKIHNSVGQSLNCGCGPFEFAFDFYSNVEKPYSFCFASFIGYDYGVKLDSHLYQTGYFKVLDTIWNFNLPFGDTIVVLGENGINCGEMLEQYQPGDSLVLALDAASFNQYSPDTFSLDGNYCGSHVLRFVNGKNYEDLTYSEVKTKMLSIITSAESAKTEGGCIVYPNPVTRELQIENHTGKKLSLKIIDITGCTIIEQPLNEVKSVINLDASSGVYFVLITDEMGQRMLEQKMVKQ